METIKNLLKPGGNNDNEQLYGSGVDPNKGKVAGEGTHFGHSHTDSGVGGVSSPTTANNPATGLTGSSATKTAEPSSSNVPIGTATTTGEREFPLSNTAAGSTSDPHSQAGVAGQDYSNVNRTAQAVPATSAAATTNTTTAALPTTSTANPTASSVPQTSSVGATGVVQEGTAPASQVSSSRAQEIYSPAQPADDKCTDTLHGGSHVTRIAPIIDPCYDQSSTGQTSATRDAGIATGPAVGTAPAAGTTTAQTSSTSHGHNSAVPAAAAVGASAGAGLAGAHAAGEPRSAGQTNVTDLNNREPRQSATAASTVPTSATSGVAGTTAGTTTAAAHPYSEKAVDPRIDNAGSANAQKYHTLDPKADQRAEPVNKDQEHHYARDAAVGGAAGAGAGAVAGHEFSKKDAEKQVEQEHKHAEKLQKEHEKDVKHAEKEHEKEVKHAEKEHEKEVKHAEKEHEKEVKHAQKEHEKEVKHAEKEQKQAEKQAEKEHKHAEKEAEKAHKEAEKAEKPSLIDRILHRGDAKKDTHEEQKAAAVGAGTGAAAATTTHDHHNKLHKDPPAGYADAPNKGYASQVTGGTGTTALASGNPVIPADTTVPGTRYGSGHDEHISPATSTQPEHHLSDPSYGVKRDSVSVAGGTVQSTTPYQPAPQTGYASQVTGGTGTTQLAQGNRDPVTNPTKSDPLKEPEHGALGYASTVTGGTGTTQLAQGTTTAVPTEGLVPGRSGSVAGVTTETPYVDGPKAGTGKYAEGVTGGTGTTQLAQGQLDEVANPRKKSVAEKIEDALVMR